MTQPQPNVPRTLPEGTSAPSNFVHDGNGAMRDVFRNRAAGVPGTGDRQLQWTYFDLPRSVGEGGQTTTFSYDAFGHRMLKERGTTWTLTVGGAFEDRSIGGGRRTTRTVTFEGRVVAVVHTESYLTTRRYVHVDRLGSGATVTGSAAGNAQLFDRVKDDPFGERRNPQALSQPTQLAHALPSSGFTGHEADDELGLTNMKGRLDDAGLGRFLSPDPMAMLTPQGLDRFAHVQNDPVNMVDPSGFEPVTISAVAAAVGTALLKGLAMVGQFGAAVSPYAPAVGAGSDGNWRRSRQWSDSREACGFGDASVRTDGLGRCDWWKTGNRCKDRWLSSASSSWASRRARSGEIQRGELEVPDRPFRSWARSAQRGGSDRAASAAARVPGPRHASAVSHDAA